MTRSKQRKVQFFRRDFIIIIFIVFVSSIVSAGKHSSSSSNSERSTNDHQQHEDSGGDTLVAQLGQAVEDMHSSASKYSAKYSSANSPYSSDAGNYYGYPSYTYSKSYPSSSKQSPSSSNSGTYYNYNPLLDTYPYYHSDRGAREFSTRQSAPIYVPPSEFPPMPTSALSPATSNHYNFVDVGPEYQELALASGGHGHGHGGGHGGHGWGWGGWGWRRGRRHHGWVNHYVSKVNTDAIGLLGLLGLLSLLSNVLLLFTTTTTTVAPPPPPPPPPAYRKKRSAFVNPADHFANVHRISSQVLPSLTLVAHARSGRIPLNCTHLEVCKTNRILINEMGFYGRPIGSRLSSAISKLLHPVDTAGNIKKHVDKAGLDGRSGKNCEKIYPVCKALENDQVSLLPVLLAARDLPGVIQGKYPSYVDPKAIPKYL